MSMWKAKAGAKQRHASVRVGSTTDSCRHEGPDGVTEPRLSLARGLVKRGLNAPLHRPREHGLRIRRWRLDGHGCAAFVNNCPRFIQFMAKLCGSLSSRSTHLEATGILLELLRCHEGERLRERGDKSSDQRSPVSVLACPWALESKSSPRSPRSPPAPAEAAGSAVRPTPSPAAMGFISKICCYFTAFIILGYLVPHLIVSFLPKQDLKKKARVQPARRRDRSWIRRSA